MSRTKGRRNLKNNYFAVYRGNEILAHGPIWELSWLFNIKEDSIRMLAAPSYRKKAERAKNPGEWLLALKVEELTDEDLEIKHRRKVKKHE
jgi:hypothetical protein